MTQTCVINSKNNTCMRVFLFSEATFSVTVCANCLSLSVLEYEIVFANLTTSAVSSGCFSPTVSLLRDVAEVWHLLLLIEDTGILWVVKVVGPLDSVGHSLHN